MRAAAIAKFLPQALVASLRPAKNWLGAQRDEYALRNSSYAVARLIGALKPGPVVITGLFSDPRGLGQAARASAAALRAMNFNVIEHDAAPYLLSSKAAPPAPSPEGGVWITHINPPELRRILRLAQPLAAAPMLRVGYWYWELPQAPSDWLSSARYLHEVWAATTFTAKAFSAQRHAKVRKVHYPLAASQCSLPDRARFGLPHNSVIFLASADARSSLARKNPAAAIRAFCLAFPQASSDAILVVKLLGAHAHQDHVRALVALAAERPDVLFITDALSSTDMTALLASADVIVALHRSEGLGLAAAEGMALGKAVIVTPWSGVQDFIAPAAVAECDFNLVPIDDPQGIYRSAHQTWAEADVQSAANWMQRLAASADLRASMGAKAQQLVHEKLSPSWNEQDLGPDFLRLARR